MKVLSIVLLIGSTQASTVAEGGICRSAADCTTADSCCSAPTTA